jgi:membrane-bound serine protease (ClpP class)
MTPTLLFLLLTALAFVLFFAEMFVPGGVLAVLGAGCLLAACGFAVVAFGPAIGILVALLLIALSLGAGIFWLSIMPDTRVGKRFALSHDLRNPTPSEPSPLLGKSGVAETDLKPGGFAHIDGRKVDVVATRGYIEAGSAINVTEVHGSRVVVQPAEESSGCARP